MELNITEQQHLANESAGESLSEPHFVEEATVASARPVVPLEEIRAEAVSRKRLVFGLSMLASLVLGVLSATLVYKQRTSTPASAIVEGAVSGSGAKSQDLAFDDGAVGDTTEDLARAEDRVEAAEPATKQPVVRYRTPAKVIDTTPDQEEIHRRERQEARRLRRAERLAERDRLSRRRPTDDVLRIREIFEGSRRP